jgi:exopolyphosphatase/guanosine-5'-triphosphate,3'-diphosphate pyrophosphatase
MAELTDLRVGEATVRSVAIESEDPARVVAVVRRFGLADRPNTCMARGLKALAGRRRAVIDVGTNSVKFHIAERRGDGGWRTISDRAEVTRLGAGVDSDGRLGATPIERTSAAVVAMAADARRQGVAEIVAVGTAALRNAPNAADLVDAVRARCGVEVEIISGEEEARLAFVATRAGLVLGSGPLVVFDTGGGSSQFTFARGEEVDERFSLDVGAARITERFGLAGPVSPEVLDATFEALAAELTAIDGRPRADAVVGMGGAVTNLAAVKHRLVRYDADIGPGTVLTRREIERQIELFRTRDAAGRRAIAGLQPNRAEVILAGACIVRTVLVLLGHDALTVSDRGLRHGVLVRGQRAR